MTDRSTLLKDISEMVAAGVADDLSSDEIAGNVMVIIETDEFLANSRPSVTSAQGAGMAWERAETAAIDFKAFYIVKDNGGEWRDFDLHVMRGAMINHKLAPNYVRGRPEWIAKITDPTAQTEGDRGGVLETLNMIAPAVENLARHQEQCDMDGVMVKVSRQALDEVLNAINGLALDLSQLPSTQSSRQEG